MKFARYLSDTQTPEWQKAYIDYRGLKKYITAIRKTQEQVADSSTHDQGQQPTSLQQGDLSASSSSSVRVRHNSAGESSRPTFARLISGSSSRRGSALRDRRFTQIKDPESPSSIDPTRQPLPLQKLLPLLSDLEIAFFHALDRELERIETFYLEREREMRERGAALAAQLQELTDHRKAYYAAHPSNKGWASALNPALARLRLTATTVEPTTDPLSHETTRASNTFQAENSTESHSPHNTNHFWAPEEYLHAKKTLKKAVQEHYRGLEVLYNYRILNYTGFTKALKKFEKVTKVDTSGISTGAPVKAMIDETELLFAARFEKGNKKKATRRLRGGNRRKTHHFSAFRAGVYIGVACPALAYGIYESFQTETREQIVAWPALLRIYGTLFIPVLFSLLVGINLLIWATARINYVFIFELDLRTRIDNRQYFETPALLLATLCYAFWLSFARIGSASISPHTWPLVWLVFTSIIMLDPFPILHRQSRFWLLGHSAKLLISGTHRVEFTSFWLGDQFCSLVYTLSNLFFLGCVYAEGFNEHWQNCGASSPRWMIPLILALLPFLVRLVQSVKRYADSGLVTHLINGGKYGSGILSNAMYFWWRHQGSPHKSSAFILWLFSNAFYSSYALIWDYIMDWSFLRPHAKYPLLRPEVVYTGHIWSYYFAIVSNAFLRFTWVFYIPHRGISIDLRSFILAFLEILRRWQWNTIRLESEFIGNVDQYRITREVPLPYAIDGRNDGGNASDDEDNDEESVQLKRRPRSNHIPQ